MTTAPPQGAGDALRSELAIWLMSCDECIGGDEPADYVEHHKRFLSRNRDAVHSGDCTKESHSCVRCICDMYLRNADALIAGPLALILAARETAEAEVGRLRDQVSALTAERDRLQDRAEAQEEALVRIVQWSEAYPTVVFTPPDYPAIRETLTANGFVPGHTLDGIAADCLRKATEGVGKIARAALSPSHPESADADRT